MFISDIHLVAVRALDVHEERVGGLHKALELVLAGLVGSRRRHKIVINEL